MLVNPPNANSHFEHVNLLGANFCASFQIKVIADYQENIAAMHFPLRSGLGDTV